MIRRFLTILAILILPTLTFAQSGAYSSPVAGGGVSTNSPVVINVKSPPYNAIGNTQQVFSVGQVAQNTNGCPSGLSIQCLDIPSAAGNPFKQSDIGLTIYANDGNAGGINRLPTTTITGVFAGTGGHIGEQMITYASTGVTNNCSGTCQVVWGTDDTAAISAAALAAYSSKSCGINGAQGNMFSPACSNLYFPPGGYMDSGGGGAVPGLNAAFWGAGPVGTTAQSLVGILTGGTARTIFYLRPDYNIGTVAPNRGVFIAGGGERIQGFSLTSSSFNFTNLGGGNNNIIDLAGGVLDIQGISIVYTGSNGTAPLINFTGRGEVHDLTVANPPVAGAPLCGFSNTGTLDVYNFVCSNGGNMLISGITGGTSSSHLTFHGGFNDEGGFTCPNGDSANICVVNSKDVVFYGTILSSGANNGNLSISVDATSEVRCAGCTLVPFATNGGSAVKVRSGGVFRATMSKFIANNSTNYIWNCATVTSCIDDGGNNYSFTNSATYLAAGSSVPYASLTHTYPQPTFAALPTSGVAATFATFTPTQPLSISRVTMVSSNSASCVTPAVFTITQSGGSTFTLTMTGSGQTSDSTAITTNNTFIAGTAINVGFTSTAYTCATAPVNMNVAIEWQSFGGL